MFFQLMIAMMLGFMSPSHSTTNNNDTMTTQDDGTLPTEPSDGVDPITGGDVRQNPPPK